MVVDTMVLAYALLHVENKYEQALAALESVDQVLTYDRKLAAKFGDRVILLE